MTSKPYKPHNRKLRHVEKTMPGKRRRKGYRYVAPGFIGMHWAFKQMPTASPPR